MLHTNRFAALGSFLASLLVLVACGGPPNAIGDGDGFGTAGSGASSGKGSGGSGAQINTGGNTDQNPGDAGAGGGGDTDTGPVCGDSKIEAPENCDDGNATPGDGCDGNCQIEENWICPKPGKACTYSPGPAVCGNGVIESGETCDLGADSTGKTLNDGTVGCSASCQTENGWTCTGAGVSCTKDAFCGDGTVQSTLGEQCDDGTNDGTHGCNSQCLVVTGWTCPNNVCVLDVSCGNGIVDSGEQCDDHNKANYDGCSSTCYIEAGYSCPPTGGTCAHTCGNGVLDAGETCDDGNSDAHDGCSSSCKVEAYYTCAMVKQPCVFTPPPPPPVCGNGTLETGEACDDGNSHSGDGCSSTCTLEAGWKCTAPNSPCVAAQCGDGILAGTEQCDDHIVDNMHGCSSTCTVMPNAVCPAAGGACIPMVCGDGKVTGTETCDTGASNDGKHGCSTTCQTVSGYICPLAGSACSAVCGDGIVAGDEQCDEKGAAPCCTAACKIVPGYVCDPSKPTHSQLAAPYCGNGTVNGPSNSASTVLGSEQCDDGNNIPFDGCSPTCTNEPLCGTYNTYITPTPTQTSFQCFAHCGDGLLVSPEQCDDGNTINGDGCDSNCKIELIPNTTTPAWTCVQPPAGTSLTLPVIWRDFTPATHPQFSVDPQVGRRMPGIVQSNLVPVNVGGTRIYKYVPVYNTSFVSPTWGGSYTNMPNWTMNGPGWVSGTDTVLNAQDTATLTNGNANPLLSPSGRFAQWYVDTASVNITVPGTISLKQCSAAGVCAAGTPVAAGTFQYSCAGGGVCDSSAAFGTTDGFFPLDGKGWVAQGKEIVRNGHNFSFTTETRDWFVFAGGEQLSFYGDDDVWVFVNGVLTLDIGGIHSQTNGKFTLGTDGNATSCVENGVTANDGGLTNNCSAVNLGLVKGKVYEIDVFNAERHVSGSNFQLTLQGFNGAPTVCTPICGDGYVAGTEQCDQGTLNVSPTSNTYGKCTTSCQLGPYCGDKLPTSPPEICDNGLNIDSYTSSAPTSSQCGPGCVAPTYCGDKIIQKVSGEECDDGTALNQNSYGHCQTNCKLGARCGDGVISNGEECDAGANNGSVSSACDATCKLKCGNGVVDSGEQCDAGKAVNGTAASSCDSTCQNKCGNGVIDAGEQCDDGASKNDGSYNNCNANCTKANYCGDGVLANPPEICDKGANNSSSAWGPDSCTLSCLPGGYCGDGIINGAEKCDDGKNTGLPGSCLTDCSGFKPSTSCGDGIIQPPEKCDDGSSSTTGNGTAASKCDTSCRLKCGNGLVDAGETCDNGVNDGTYGTCTSTCKLAGYCGDGIKNGNEQCDSGGKNVDPSTAYGTGVCTKACKAAPFCGDGKIQPAHEDCEGNVNCANCTSTIPK